MRKVRKMIRGQLRAYRNPTSASSIPWDRFTANYLLLLLDNFCKK